MKKIEEMSDREILEELLKDKRRNDIISYIRLGILAVVIIAIIIIANTYVPKIIEFSNRLNSLLGELETTGNMVQEIAENIDVETIDSLKDMIAKIQGLLNMFGIRS